MSTLKNYEYGSMQCFVCSTTWANHFIMSKKCFIMSSRKRFQTLLEGKLSFEYHRHLTILKFE